MSRIRSLPIVASLLIALWVQQPAAASNTLVAALDAYEKAVLDKLNSDLETISRAFADARDIQKARRWADWAKFPLDIIRTSLDLPSFLRDFRSVVAGIEKAENQLELISKLFLLHSISESAGGFKLAISGPEYDRRVRRMLAEADTSKDKKAYQDIISLYLHGLSGRVSPAPIVIETEQGKETLPGVREFKSTLRALLNEAKQRAVALSGPPEAQLNRVVEEVGRATLKVRESKSKQVEASAGLVLGRVNTLERIRGQALSRYDRDMKIEQVNTVVSSLNAVCAATSYYLTGGITIGNAQHCVPLRDANALLRPLTLAYQTSARKQVDQVPFEMLLSLSGEAASLWKTTRQVAERIKGIALVAKDQAIQEMQAGLEKPAAGTRQGPLAEEMSQEQARVKLLEMGIPYSEEAFRENAKKGNTDAVKLFLAAGVNPDAKSPGNDPALMWAAFGGHTDTVQILIAKGANVNATRDKDGLTALMMAVDAGRTATIGALMAGGANVNAKSYKGSTALMMAARKGHPAAIQALIAGGADVNAKSNDGATALMDAAAAGHTDIVQLLNRAEESGQVAQTPLAQGIEVKSGRETTPAFWWDQGGNRTDSCSWSVKGAVPHNVDFRGNDEAAKAHVWKGAQWGLSGCSKEIESLKETSLKQAVSYTKRLDVVILHAPATPCPVGLEERVCFGNYHLPVVEGAFEFSVNNRGEVSALRPVSYENLATKRWLPRADDSNTVKIAERSAAMQARYRLKADTPRYCEMNNPVFDVIVEVPLGIDLSKDLLARAYAATGLRYATTQCQKVSFEAPFGYDFVKRQYPASWKVSVYLYQGGREWIRAAWVRHVPWGFSFDFKNLVLEQMQAEKKAREEAERAKREAEKREVAIRTVRERLSKFSRENRVQKLVTCFSLSTNPYAYEGQVVALPAEFGAMTARDQGLFRAGLRCQFVVSSVPPKTLGTEQWEVLIAGKVTGHTNVKMGTETVRLPELKFVGIHVCKERECRDILPPN